MSRYFMNQGDQPMSTTYKIDPAHSSAQFVVRHMMITNVRGAFSNLQGAVVWDPAQPNHSTVEVDIDTTTIQTQDAGRDAHLKSADFLDVEKFPTITFKSTGIESVDTTELTITGDLTIHGVTKQV